MAKKIEYTSHLELRMKVRNISSNLPRKIYRNANAHYLDRLTNHRIAIKSVKIKGTAREFMVAYDEYVHRVRIITIHPLKPYQKLSRVNSGRWRKL